VGPSAGGLFFISRLVVGRSFLKGWPWPGRCLPRAPGLPLEALQALRAAGSVKGGIARARRPQPGRRWCFGSPSCLNLLRAIQGGLTRTGGPRAYPLPAAGFR